MSPEHRTREDWLREYERSHSHPANRLCHMFGIPLIAGSMGLLLMGWWQAALVAYGVGWVLQFAGHALEGKPPEFLRDWRFLLVGLLWWSRRIRGRQ